MAEPDSFIEIVDGPLLHKHRTGHSRWTTLLLLLNYLKSDTQKRPRSFRVGVFSVFIVVAFLSFLLSTLLLGGAVYLKVAENEASEADLILVPATPAEAVRTELESPQTVRLIDYYALEQSLKSVQSIEGVTPRWILPAEVFATDNDELRTSCYLIVADTKRERDIGLGRAFSQRVLGYGEAFATASILRTLGLNEYEGEHLRLEMNLVKALAQVGLIDSGYGSDEEAVAVFLERFGVLDDISTVTVTKSDLEDALGQNLTNVEFTEFSVSSELISDAIINSFIELARLSLDFSIAEVVEKSNGKWQNTLGNVILIDAAYVQAEVLNAVNQVLSSNLGLLGASSQVSPVLEALQRIDIYNYTLFANIMMKDRMSAYLGSVEDMQLQFTQVTNEIYETIGYGHPTHPNTLLADQMHAIQIVKSFLNNVFMAVLALLMILSVLLIYSLVMSDIEQKTYEFGMLRALGLKQSALLSYLVLFASAFAFPGLFLGLLLSFLLNVISAFAIAEYTTLPLSLLLHPAALALGTALGLLLPLLSTYIPISRALTKTLRDSLDLYHRVLSDVTVTIQKLEKQGVAPHTLVASILLVVMGFVTYYLVPLAFQLKKIEIFLMLLNLILLLMILGLTFVCNMLQPHCEQACASLLLWALWRDRNLKSVVKKNLEGHQARNWKTGLMFSMALSFIVFAGVAFRLQGRVIKDTLTVTFGGDLYVKAPSKLVGGLHEGEIRDWLDNTYGPHHEGYVESFTFMSFPMDDLPGVEWTGIGNICGFPLHSTTLIGVEHHYLDSVHQEFFLPTESQEGTEFESLDNGEDDLISGLYSNSSLNENTGSVDSQGVLTGFPTTDDITSKMDPVKLVIAEGLRDFMSMNTETPARLQVAIEAAEDDLLFVATIKGMAQKLPGFAFSAYTQITFFSTTVLGLPQFAAMLDAAYKGEWPHELTDELPSGVSYQIPKMYMILKLSTALTTTDRNVLSNGLRNFFTTDETFLIDVLELKETAELTVNMMEAFFILVGIIAFILAFFLLWTNITGNVTENSWEYGVLRAIGLTSAQCTRIYIYESLILCVTASALGFVVGITIAFVLTLQMNLFTELPFRVDFPVVMCSVMVLLSVAMAFLGSYLPAKQIELHKIATVLKGVNIN